MTAFTASVVEDAALDWLKAIGWRIAHGPEIAPPCLSAGRDMPAAERANYGEVVLAQRLRDALARLNPTLPAEAPEDAYRKLTWPESADLIQRNRALHRLLGNGVTVDYRTRKGLPAGQAGEVRGAQSPVIDFDGRDANLRSADVRTCVQPTAGSRPWAAHSPASPPCVTQVTE